MDSTNRENQDHIDTTPAPPDYPVRPCITPPPPDNTDPPQFPAQGKALAVWLADMGWSHTDLAELLNVSRPAVTMWTLGTRRPDHFRAAAIEVCGGPEVFGWATQDEQRAAENYIKAMTERMAADGCPIIPQDLADE